MVFAQLEVHLPFDQPVAAVLPDEDHQRYLFADRSLDFLRVHQEGAVACHCQHLHIGLGNLHADRAGQRKRHGGQSIRDQAGIAFVGRVQPRHPHLRRPGVDQHDIAAAKGGPGVRDDTLWREREPRILLPPREFVGEQSGSRCGVVVVESMTGQCGGQRVQRLADVTDDAHRNRVVHIYLGREAMNVDDLLVACRVDPDRIEFLQFVSDRDDHVRRLESEVDVVAAHEPQRADAIGVVIGHHAFAMESVRHLDTEFVGEPHQRCSRVTACSTVACQHHGPLRVAKNLDRALHLSGRRRFCSYDVARQRRQVVVRFVGIDVLGDSEINGGGAFGLGQLERLADHLGYRPRRRDAVRPAGDGGKHRYQVDVLVRLLVLAVLADLSRDCHQRGAVGGGVGDAQLHVDGARTQRRRCHGGAPGDTAVHLGHERRTLLVAGEDIADRRGGQRLNEADVLLSRHPEHD